MAIIGPSFADELTAAGIKDRRFSWGVEDGVIEFHPDVPDTERQKVLAVLAAHDGPLSEARHQAMEAANAEAGRRIAEMFQRQADTFNLIYAELNALARAVQILNRKIDGSASPEERRDLDVLDRKYDMVGAIRQTEDKAKADLRGAKSVGEVQTVKPAWPAEENSELRIENLELTEKNS